MDISKLGGKFVIITSCMVRDHIFDTTLASYLREIDTKPTNQDKNA